ncbi:MAG: aminotransferase class I/II-fold pyridoxal phosphate-dependent enzyme [Ruminococcaceae bacterium]|nr:aminotransferase class I/II-fold pyridoxal phosphate-dependent enzyme [Oscillospiraceae bacterium]
MTLYQRLINHREKDPVRLHMPGHKGKGCDKLWNDIFSLDITEISDFDDLFDPQECLFESQALAAKLWGAKESFYLVGSSTAGILSAVLSQKKPLIIARNCHKSVYHAAELSSLPTSYIMPSYCQKRGIFLSVTAESVENALKSYPDGALVVITSPSYDGVISDVESIARICHSHNSILLVDEAHGAHLGLYGVFEKSAVKCGADIVIQSLHKTLPSLTQTGIAHICSDRVNRSDFFRHLQMLQSSSPSYILMASIDLCVNTLLKEGEKLLQGFSSTVDEFRLKLSQMNGFDLIGKGEGIWSYDKTKCLLRFPAQGRLVQKELEKMGIYPEMSLGNNLLLMTGTGTDERDASRTISALSRIKVPQGDPINSFSPELPRIALPCNEALKKPCKAIRFSDCAGKVSTEYLWAYPPGIPLVCPGEQISLELSEIIQGLFEGSQKLVSTNGGAKEGFLCVCDA